MKLRQWVSVWVCLWMAELGTVETGGKLGLGDAGIKEA